MSRVWHRDRFTPSPRCLESKCVVCGRSMWLPASKSALYKTCGGDCARKNAGADRAARERCCEKCGSRFAPRRVQITNGQGRFCSQACNTVGWAIAQSPENRAKRAEAWKQRHRASPIVKSGEQSPKWRGGRKATVRRRLDAGYYREANHRRRLNTRQIIDAKLISALVEKQRWRCACCSASVRKGYEMDHIVPLALGGAHHIDNIQILCVRCNRSKGAKHPLEHARRIGKLL